MQVVEKCSRFHTQRCTSALRQRSERGAPNFRRRGRECLGAPRERHGWCALAESWRTARCRRGDLDAINPTLAQFEYLPAADTIEGICRRLRGTCALVLPR